MASLDVAAERKNIGVLVVLQALLLTNAATALTVAGLVGRDLAKHRSLATLPITGWVAGSFVTTYFASLLMRRIGRRGGFRLGGVLGVLGAAICCLGLVLHHFWVFVLGSFVFGAYNAFGQYHRFAAADVAAPERRARAISYVLAGGLVGGVVGPALSGLTVELLPTRFLGVYAALIGVLLLVQVALFWLRMPPTPAEELAPPERPLSVVAAQPIFVVSVLCAALAFGVMNLLMTATPLAMGACGLPYGSAATVISSHVIAMFAPSFVTGDLVKRFGALRVMGAGVALNLVCVAIARSGLGFGHFWWALVLLGVGWNFLYVGSTTLLTESYRPSEKAGAQGVNDLVVSLVMMVTSFSSGLLFERAGWWVLSTAAVPVMLIMAAAVAFLSRARRLSPA